MRSLETRFFVNKGLKNFKNKFLQALVEAQSFSMKGILDIREYNRKEALGDYEKIEVESDGMPF